MKIADHGPALANLQELVDSVPALIHAARPDGFIDFFNQRWLEYVGRRLEDLEGWKWTAAVHPDDVDALVAGWQACLASGEPFEFESRVRRADGAYRWMWHQALPLRNASGVIVRWCGSSADVDDRKQTEFYLAEGQQLARTGSWAFNAAGFEYWSSELFKIHGLNPGGHPPTVEEYTGLVHPDDRAFVVGEMHKMLAEHHGCDFTKRIVRPDGSIRHVRCVGVPRTRGEALLGFVGTGTDVTEQEQLTVELRRSKAHLVDAQRLSRTGSVGMEVSTKRIFWSDEAARIYGYPPGTEPTPQLILQRSHPDDVTLLKDVLTRAAQGGADFDFEHRLLMPDGSIKYLRNLAHGVKDEAGNEEVIGAIMDITAPKVAEAAIRRNEAELREQEAELRQMLDLAPQIIAVLGPGRERLYANRGALAYYAISLDAWRARSVDHEVHPDDYVRFMALVDRSRSEPAFDELEMRLRKGDGSYRWFLVQYNPLHDEHGQLIRWYVACTDVDDRKRAEERLQQENVALREEIDKTSMFEEIVGASAALQEVIARVSKVAASDSTVLVSGETGTGKELVARAIHRRSGRSPRAFVAVNCAAIPRDLIASELFGHEKGAFTGATQRRLGRFELADGGTIFLDEVSELSPDTQVALLRVLQEREFERLGGRQPIRVDVRVIAATNRDLAAAVDGGTFREDLFYRLNVFPIAMPSLRERADDIPVLVAYFIDRYARKAGKTIRRVNRRTLDRLQSYFWPGNVRELQNVIERSVIVCDADEFTVDQSWLSGGPAVESRLAHLALSSTLAGHEKSIIEDALRASGGRVFGPSGAASRLGIARSTLESKIRVLGINKNRFRGRATKP